MPRMGALAATVDRQQLPLLPLQGAAYRNRHAWLVSSDSDRPQHCLVICCPASCKHNGAVLPLSAAPVGRGADGVDAMA
jgi:hypothetical protein